MESGTLSISPDVSFTTLLWCFILIQVLGLVSALAARISERSRLESPCQRVFWVLMVVVALATLAALSHGPAECLTSGTTLAVMSLVAICDFRSSSRRLA